MRPISLRDLVVGLLCNLTIYIGGGLHAAQQHAGYTQVQHEEESAWLRRKIGELNGNTVHLIAEKLIQESKQLSARINNIQYQFCETSGFLALHLCPTQPVS